MHPTASPPPPTLTERLTRPLWDETPAERERRRGHLLVTGPFAGLIGLSAGALAVGQWGVAASPLVFAGAVGGFLVAYLAGQVESLARSVAHVRGGPASLGIRLGADFLGGAVLGRVLGAMLDADALASLAAGGAILAGAGFVVTRGLWGGWVEGINRVLTGQTESRRPTDHSYPRSLAARGLIEEALAEYEVACRERPGDPEPMLHAAWTMRDCGRWEQAVIWYTRALETSGLDVRRAASVVRLIQEIHETKLHRPEAARPWLEALVERWPDAEEVEWARSELKRASTGPEPR